MSVFGHDDRYALAYSDEGGALTILVAGDHLTTTTINALVQRLRRIDWQNHLVWINLEDLDVADLALTLNDALSAVEGRGRVQSRYAVTPAAGPTLVDRLEIHAGTWQTREARSAFKTLLESATSRPQVVDRPDGERVYVVSENVLRAYSEPLTTPELVATFAHPPMDMRISVPPRPMPRGVIDLGVAPAGIPSVGTAVGLS